MSSLMKKRGIKSWKTNSQILFTWFGDRQQEKFNQQDLDLRGLGSFLFIDNQKSSYAGEGSQRTVEPFSVCATDTLSQLLTKFQGCVLSTHVIRTTYQSMSARCKKNLTFNVFSFHLLLKSSEKLVHYHAIHVVSLFLTLFHVIIIPHKRGTYSSHLFYSSFP